MPLLMASAELHSPRCLCGTPAKPSNHTAAHSRILATGVVSKAQNLLKSFFGFFPSTLITFYALFTRNCTSES